MEKTLIEVYGRSTWGGEEKKYSYYSFVVPRIGETVECPGGIFKIDKVRHIVRLEELEVVEVYGEGY